MAKSSVRSCSTMSLSGTFVQRGEGRQVQRWLEKKTMKICELISRAFVEIAGRFEDPQVVMNEVAQASGITGRCLLNEISGAVFQIRSPIWPQGVPRVVRELEWLGMVLKRCSYTPRLPTKTTSS